MQSLTRKVALSRDSFRNHSAHQTEADMRVHLSSAGCLLLFIAVVRLAQAGSLQERAPENCNGVDTDYAAVIAHRIRARIADPSRFAVSGAKPAEARATIEIWLDPLNGTVTGVRLLHPSNSSAWDSELMIGVIKASPFPPDRCGRLFTPMEVMSSPNDP